ncbi:coiled-coil domain-containing protein 106-like [Carassius carassius]|uniref:coiled-coil domain-containing protein 106-like n=1 Tax=Carassius carassius TaxID=217509 RepID=UPI002868FC33|nr:coiled-coil domain-containing protein 106-like [Carassius carassius]
MKEERDFLREQLRGSLNKRQLGTNRRMQNDSSSESESADNSTFSDTSDSSDKPPKRKHKRKHKVREDKDTYIRRVKTPDDVLHRYKAILKSFLRTRSVSRSCKLHNVDRNTIALTAIIAELQIIATPELHIPEFQGGTLQKFAKKCKEYLDTKPEVMSKITEMKQNRELLPIGYKFRKEDK